LLLGLAVTASHSLGVLALAGIVLVAGGALPADRLYPVLSGLSGLLVVGIGAWLLIGCLRQRRVHDHAHRHDHPHLHPHPHDAGGVGRGGLLAIGLAGGMIPSPAALVLLLGAIAAGQPAYGLLLAVAFGAGMAVVLVALGLLVVRGRAQVVAVARRLPALVRLAPAVPWVAAAVVLVGGIALTGGAVAAAI
jgi:ABC-type nickel/cobalt efflux system permease component RcnA